MNSLIIGACFVVAILAVIGLVFALQEPAAKAGNAATTTPEASTVAPPAAKTTTQLSDLPIAEGGAPIQTDVLPDPQGEEYEPAKKSDVDEQSYADLPTIRSISPNHHDVTSKSQHSQVTYEHLQMMLEELRGLHTQMKNMEQRINVLTDQVQYLHGNDDKEEDWGAPNPTLRVPAQ